MMVEGAICKGNPAKAERDQNVAALRMSGATLAQMERQLGYSKGHLSHLLNNDKDIKALIEQASKAQATMLPKAIERHCDLLTSPETDDKDLIQAIKLTYINTGVSPTHTQPQIINNILIQQQTVLDPALMKGFGDWFFNGGDGLPGETVPDAEIVNDNNE